MQVKTNAGMILKTPSDSNIAHADIYTRASKHGHRDTNTDSHTAVLCQLEKGK